MLQGLRCRGGLGLARSNVGIDNEPPVAPEKADVGTWPFPGLALPSSPPRFPVPSGHAELRPVDITQPERNTDGAHPSLEITSAYPLFHLKD